MSLGRVPGGCWCGVVWCGVVWCGVVWCGVVWCGVVWCGVVWCGVVWCPPTHAPTLSFLFFRPWATMRQSWCLFLLLTMTNVVPGHFWRYHSECHDASSMGDGSTQDTGAYVSALVDTMSSMFVKVTCNS